MPKPSNDQSNKRRPQARGRKRSHSSNLPEGLPADVEEYGEDLAALEEADGEEINIVTCRRRTSPSERDGQEMIENFSAMRKHEMIFQILRKHAENRGVLLQTACWKSTRRLRLPAQPALQLSALPEDVYVSPSQIRRLICRLETSCRRIRPSREGEILCASDGR